MKQHNWVASVLVVGLSVLGGLLAPVAVHADSTVGDIWYTTFSGTDRVFKRSYNFDGVALTYGGEVVISSTTLGLGGADGLVFDPTDGNFLLVGGQNKEIYRVNIGTGAVTPSTPTAGDNFHLAITPGLSTVLGFGTENGGGTLVNSVGITPFNVGNSTFTIAGDDLKITGIAFDGTGAAYYTNSVGAGGGGGASFGTATAAGGVITTTRLLIDDAAHGITFDPFTGSFILVGDNKIAQYKPGSGIISTYLPGGSNVFDQASIDGNGHLFAASNDGDMLFIDYAASGLVGGGSNFTDIRFFRDTLDDVAPLTRPIERGPIPEPASMLLFGLGGLGAAFTRRRRSSKLSTV